MVITVYHAEGYVTSWVDQEKDLMVVRTYKLNLGEHGKAMFVANIAAVAKYKPKNILLDKSEATGMQDPREEEKWLRETLFPQYRSAGLKKVISVLPRNPIARFGTRNWLDIGKEFGFEFIEVHTIEDAYQHLAY